MAAIQRRSFSELKSEFIRAARGIRYESWASRAEYLLTDAYYDIASLYHHRELEEIVPASVAENAITTPYPENAHIIFLVAEIDGEGFPTRMLDLVHIGLWSSIFLATTGRPGQYGTFKRVVYFNCRLDQARSYNIHFQRRPTAPDFASTSYPEIAEVWDSHIVELALVKAGVRTGDEALATLNAQLYKDFVGQQPQPLLIASTAPARSGIPTQDQPQSGMAT